MSDKRLGVEDLHFASLARDVFIHVPLGRAGELRRWLRGLGLGSTVRLGDDGEGAHVHPHTNLSAARVYDLLAAAGNDKA
jgi:hypothetical protein